jgi:hypothetical protein
MDARKMDAAGQPAPRSHNAGDGHMFVKDLLACLAKTYSGKWDP